MGDLISRQDAIRLAEQGQIQGFEWQFKKLCELSSAEPEIIHCIDCKFYTSMNCETKTGICNLIMHQNFGDNWFCAGAERRTDE